LSKPASRANQRRPRRKKTRGPDRFSFPGDPEPADRHCESVLSSFKGLRRHFRVSSRPWTPKPSRASLMRSASRACHAFLKNNTISRQFVKKLSIFLSHVNGHRPGPLVALGNAERSQLMRQPKRNLFRGTFSLTC
jgi:hypothetical protein